MTTAIHSLMVLQLTSEIQVSLGLCPFSEYPRKPSAPASQQPLTFLDLSLHHSHLCLYHHMSFLKCLSFYMEVSSLGMCLVAQLCPTLGDPMDCSLPGSSVPRQTLFWGAPKSLQVLTATMKLKDAYSLEEKL